MTAYIHPTALVNPGFVPAPFTIIDEGAAIFADVTVGSFVRVHAGARLHEGCIVGDHVTIGYGVELHDNVVVADLSFVGKAPEGTADEGEGQSVPLSTSVGEDTSIGSMVIVELGATVGARCVLGDRVTITSTASVADDTVVAAGSIVT